MKVINSFHSRGKALPCENGLKPFMKGSQVKKKPVCFLLPHQNGTNQIQGKTVFWQRCGESGTLKYCWHEYKPFLMEKNSAVRITGAIKIIEAIL